MKSNSTSQAKSNSKSKAKAESKAKSKTKTKTPPKAKSGATKKANSSSRAQSGSASKKISKPKSKPTGFVANLKWQTDKIVEQVENLFASRPQNIESAIKTDHESLRNFLKVLKDTDEDMTLRRRAYEQFSALLKSHSTAEEGIVYAAAEKLPGREMQIKIQEGYVEHRLADDLMLRIEKTKDPTEWSAHANVLSEIVEHHLKEEERDLLPLIGKGSSAELDEKMLKAYMTLREKTQKKVTPRNAGILKN